MRLLAELRGDVLAQPLAEIEPDAHFALLQIDHELGVRAPRMLPVMQVMPRVGRLDVDKRRTAPGGQRSSNRRADSARQFSAEDRGERCASFRK